MVATSVPNTSCLLIIEPTSESLITLPKAIQSTTIAKFKLLDQATDLVKVPQYFALNDEKDLHQDDGLLRSHEKTKQKVFSYISTQAPWQNSKLVAEIKSEKRERLFVCGFWLDASLGSAALEAFVEGFDVHLITDLSFSRSEIERAGTINRLMQYGVVPITMSQLIFEWMSWTSDPETASALKLIAANLHEY